MKLRLILICFFWVLIFCDYTFSAVIPLYPDRVNLLIVGEEAVIKTRALDKNVKRVICKVSGDAVHLVKRQGIPSSGYIFQFKAVKPGEAVIIEEIVRYAKGGEKADVFRFAVKVFSQDGLERVKLSSIASDPLRFKDRLFIVSGINRGWGSPVKAKTVWGRMLTRSDWVIEDETGAAFVKGFPFSFEKKPVTMVCRILVLPDGGWILVVHKILKR